MAWPPPTLSTSRSNATPQQNTHAADHNAANLAINDLVTKVLVHDAEIVGFQIQSNQTSATTNINGEASFSFNAFFSGNPVVVANVQSVAATGLIVMIRSVTTGGFVAAIYTHAGLTFQGGVTLSWIALGYRIGFGP